MITAKLSRLSDGVVMAAPSPRIRVIWHHNQGQEHTVAYLGFVDAAVAEACYRHLSEKVGRYDRQANAGVNKPRKAARVEGCPLEIKWHNPQPALLAQLIEKDLARAKVAA